MEYHLYRSTDDADYVLACGTDWEECGVDLSIPGDLDGDGSDDIVVGAAMEYPSTSPQETGRLWVLDGPITADVTIETTGLDWTGAGEGDQAGEVVQGVGDLNGDGVPDVAVGAPGNDEVYDGAGAAYVLYGPAGAGGSLETADAALYGGHTATNGNRSTGFGSAIAGIGDLTGDGAPELAVAQYFYDTDSGVAGAIHVFEGPIEGGFVADDDALVLLTSPLNNRFGEGPDSVGGGDFDGDGYSDVVAGNYLEPSESSSGVAGAVYFFSGGGLEGELSYLSADAKLMGDDPQGALGYSVVSPGDLDGDGFGDALLSAANASDGATGTGLVYAIYGPVSGSHGVEEVAGGSFAGGGTNWSLNVGAEATADLTGDGLLDLWAGATGASVETTFGGAVAIFPGLPR